MRCKLNLEWYILDAFSWTALAIVVRLSIGTLNRINLLCLPITAAVCCRYGWVRWARSIKERSAVILAGWAKARIYVWSRVTRPVRSHVSDPVCLVIEKTIHWPMAASSFKSIPALVELCDFLALTTICFDSHIRILYRIVDCKYVFSRYCGLKVYCHKKTKKPTSSKPVSA